VSSAKTDEAIETPFALRTRVGPKEPAIRYSGALPAEYCVVGIPQSTQYSHLVGSGAVL